VNAGELGVGASGDLSSPELDQLASIRQHAIPSIFLICDVRLELSELAREVLLGLVPQLGGLLQRV
jgi:hypothetical protein